MSKKLEIRFKEGDRITFDGKKVVITEPTNEVINAIVLGESAEETEAEGEHQSDKPKGISKDSVLSIVRKEIDRLEQEETQILMENPLEDDGLFEHSPSLLADHISNAQAVMVLKKLLKRVEKL